MSIILLVLIIVDDYEAIMMLILVDARKIAGFNFTRMDDYAKAYKQKENPFFFTN